MENIERVFYINLDHRTDRRSNIETQLQLMGLWDISERFPAIKTSPGYIGCSKSHLAVYRIIKERGYKNVLVFEDDFTFVVSKDAFEKTMRDFASTHIDTYSACMLAYNHTLYERVNELVGRCVRTCSSSGYMLSHRIIDQLVASLEVATVHLEETRLPHLYAADVHWFPLQQEYENWYYFETRIGIQAPGYSDIENHYVDYKV